MRKPPAWPSVCAPWPPCRTPGRAGTAWLLEEYALLHLLAVAYRRQGELPPPLRETVRSRIGFSLRQADVLAGGDPVRDHWQVLARRDLEQDRIRSRRTWLRGRKTGRDALLLSFAAAGQALDDSLAVGTDADADLVFYPGAVPLRAVVLARHDDGDGGADRRTAARSPGCWPGTRRRSPPIPGWTAGSPSWRSRRPAPRPRPSATRPATPCRCTRGPATAGRCSRSPAAAR